MVEEVETLDGTAHAPDDRGSDPVASQLVAGRGTDGSGRLRDPDDTARAKRRPRKVRSLTLDDGCPSAAPSWPRSPSCTSAICIWWTSAARSGLPCAGTSSSCSSTATVVAIANPRHIVTERLVAATLYLIAVLVIFALAHHGHLHLRRGLAGLRPHQLLHPRHGRGLYDAPLNQGGIFHAIVGTVIYGGAGRGRGRALGIGTAVYMTEVKGPGSHLIRTVVEAMTALSAFWPARRVRHLVVGFGLGKTGLAAAIAIAVTMLPLVARASEVALRVVPGGLREASEALGATHWKTTWSGVAERAGRSRDSGHPCHCPASATRLSSW